MSSIELPAAAAAVINATTNDNSNRSTDAVHTSSVEVKFHLPTPPPHDSGASRQGSSGGDTDAEAEELLRSSSPAPSNNIHNVTIASATNATTAATPATSSPSPAATPTSPKSDEQENGVEDDDDDDEEEIVCRVKRYKWKPPPGSEKHVYKPHQGEGSQYLRDFILGVNDGIISTFLLIVGVVAGGGDATTVLLSGISSAVAGAISMGLGEYIATKSQYNVNQGEFELEKEHFRFHRDVELEQLRGFLRSVGLEGALLEAVVSQVGRNDEWLMKMMQAFEFGGSNEEIERNPLMAMWTSGRLFMIGALPSVVPFFFVNDALMGLWISGILVAASLFFVGAYKTRTTRGNMWYEGGENFLFGLIGTGVSFGVGIAFQKASGNGQLAF